MHKSGNTYGTLNFYANDKSGFLHLKWKFLVWGDLSKATIRLDKIRSTHRRQIRALRVSPNAAKDGRIYISQIFMSGTK